MAILLHLGVEAGGTGIKRYPHLHGDFKGRLAYNTVSKNKKAKPD